MLVGINYFTKWVEAEPLANIRDMDAKRFVWKKKLSLNLGSLIPLSWIMAFSLIARLSEGTVVIWELQIGIPPQLIHGGMDRQRLSIRS